jgi:hypothetical protein
MPSPPNKHVLRKNLQYVDHRIERPITSASSAYDYVNISQPSFKNYLGSFEIFYSRFEFITFSYMRILHHIMLSCAAAFEKKTLPAGEPTSLELRVLLSSFPARPRLSVSSYLLHDALCRKSAYKVAHLCGWSNG